MPIIYVRYRLHLLAPFGQMFGDVVWEVHHSSYVAKFRLAVGL